jgi:hypothetical protein
VTLSAVPITRDHVAHCREMFGVVGDGGSGVSV